MRKITMVRRMEKLRSLCREQARLRKHFYEPADLRRLWAKVSLALRGILLAADWSGTVWHLRRHCHAYHLGARTGWEITIGGSLELGTGDIATIRKAIYLVDSEHHTRLVLNRIAETFDARIILHFDSAMTLTFPANKKSRQFLERRKIRIDLTEYKQVREEKQAELKRTVKMAERVVGLVQGKRGG